MIMATLASVVSVMIVLGILSGWVIPLVVGILRRRSGHRAIGWFVFSGLWGLAAICLIGLPFFIAGSMRSYSPEKFDASNYSGATGKVSLPFEGDVMLQLLDKQNHRVLQCPGKGGMVVVPAGNYQPHQIEAFSKDGAGELWVARSYLGRGGGGQFSLAAAGTHALDVGPPFVARVTTGKGDDGEVEFNFEMSGRGGNQYVVSPSGRSQTASPAFEVLSANGQVLWRGNFKYG